MELADLTVTEASSRIHNGELSPVDLVEANLARIEAHNPHLNAFLTILPDAAREQAQQAADALGRGEDWGTLHGIPIAVKDLIHMAGVRTTAGSQFVQEQPTEDAVVIQQLRAAGAIIIGKTNLHEFAIGATNVNPHYGSARNPWDPEMSPGGSSGGSAAAVAAGMCTAALGTDTGGSVRLPAALTNLTGLRPPPNAVSTRGVIPMSWTLDTVGPMTHTAADAALLYDALQTTPSHTIDQLDAALQPLRIGVPDGDFFSQKTTIEVAAAVGEAVNQLVEIGMEQVTITLPGIRDALRAAGIISLGDAAAYHTDKLADDTALAKLGDDVRARLEWGQQRSAPDYAAARQQARLWQHEVTALFRHQCQLIAVPTTPLVCHPIAGSEGLRAARDLLRFTYPFSLAGLPALSVPCGFTTEGLPIGMQLIGPDTGLLLHVAHLYQQHTGWHTRRPYGDYP